ncbi:HD domain-containing phosphohydrolase [Desulfosporosinus sp.]|uniref:HD-GYP domain-containing protein n=1 Tax=Desulfosporosinus sp. TaxID=157907 RepID=UPI0025C5A4F4|nr:HD domain-containing phosphohydrolase [Desulfosporosinus sp.]MBC2721759.1 HD domain-containing protein [Desulfosporosinus sp.]MBC2726189.1 HD domain-containing protein [Desulfosporosinus sp.]
MDFNLNEFLGAVANTLDIIEIDIFGMATNHSKRLAYISVKMAHEIRMNSEEIFDLASLAMLHDNGASMKILHDNLMGTAKEKIDILESRKEHCIIGEDNLKNFPFLTNPQNIIIYHHEKYDGSGFFGISKDEIPLMAQIIAFSDTIDLAFDLRKTFNKEIVTKFVREHKNTFFSPLISDVFCKISEQHEFWDALSDGKIDDSLKMVIPNYSKELNYNEIHTITKTLSKIIDSKSQYTQSHSSGLSMKLKKIAEFYKMDPIITLKLLIASDLHDLGKLAISNNLLDKPGKLSKEEYEVIKKHPRITRLCLQNIKGFEEITRWASNHHEKLDGSGYPEALKAEELDFNSRLITCLDIYQALREERPYRKSMDHQKAMEILVDMVDAGQLDQKIVDDINLVFINCTN